MTPDLPDGLREPAGPALAAYALRLLDAAAAARDRMAAGHDGEALHDLRVAVRRLRSLLRAHRAVLDVPRRARRRLRDIAQATGDVRDLEVQLVWLREARPTLGIREKRGLTWLAARLQKEERSARHRLAEDLPELFARAEEALHKVLTTRATAPRAGEGEFGSAVAALLPDLIGTLRLSLADIHSMEDQAQAHAARIAAKRLRYALEPVGELLPEAASLATDLGLLQDVLGEMHDAEVLSGAIAAAVEKSGAAQARRASRTVRRGEVAKMARDAVQRQRRRDPTPGLLALAAVVRAAQEHHYRTLEQEWLGGRAMALIDAVEVLARKLAPAAAGNLEIERKYLLRGLPELPGGAGRRTLEIEQGYIPGERVRERIRRVRENGRGTWYRTMKLGMGLERLEFEDETTAEIFDAMWPLTAGHRLRKRRHVVPEGELAWEIDQFLDRELVLAELEIPSAETPVTVPDWLAPYVVREVTGELEYLNSTLAR
jgi:CHAD domain-containing protein/CYTH domain-containing protein